MKLLLDTHILLWAAYEPKRLSKAARFLLEHPDNELLFSAASIWEVAIKSSLGRKDFSADARVLRRSLIDSGYTELPVTSEHAVNLDRLPDGHKDPFDRILAAQAMVEGITLVTSDTKLLAFPTAVKKV